MAAAVPMTVPSEAYKGIVKLWGGIDPRESSKGLPARIPENIRQGVSLGDTPSDIAVRICLGETPDLPAPKGEWRTECREESDQRYDRSTCVPACDWLPVQELDAVSRLCEAILTNHKALLSGLRVAPVSTKKTDEKI